MNTLVFILAVIGATAIIVGLAYAVVYAFNRKSILRDELELIAEINAATNDYDAIIKRIKILSQEPNLDKMKALVGHMEQTFNKSSYYGKPTSSDSSLVLRARMRFNTKGETAHREMAEMTLNYLKAINSTKI
jgi:hypothetical protein